MRRRIFLLSALLAGLSVLVTAIFISWAGYDDFFEGIQHEVEAEAGYICAGYALAGEGYLDALDHPIGHRLTVIAPDGTVLHDSAEKPERMDNHLSRPEVQGALAGGAGESTRYSDTIREQTYYYAVLLEDGSVLRLSTTTASIFAAMGQLLWMAALIVLLVLGAAALVASRMTLRIVRPINSLDLEHPEHGEVYDELLPLLRRIREQRGKIDSQMAALDQGRREFAAITDHMREGFLVLDRTGGVLSYNKSALSLLGVHTVPPAVSNALAFNRSEGFRALVQSALGGKTDQRIVTVAGCQCQIFASPVVEGGAVRGIVLLLLDVTEQQGREALRREFTANVSHELKTPLTAISGYAEIMANGLTKPEDVPGFAGKIYAEAGRLIALVSDLMLLSGLEEGSRLEKEPVELLSLARAAALRLTSETETYGVALSVSGEAVTILGIPSVLDEMIGNLAENGIKYTPQGGRVSIHVTRQESGAVLTVTDNGIGIPKAEQGRIFERFYRVDKSHSRAIPGTGLGLSIVKHGAALHGGTIEVDSDGVSGTRVILRMAAEG